VEPEAAGTTGAKVGVGVAKTNRETTGTTFASATIKFGTLITVAKCFNICVNCPLDILDDKAVLYVLK
jgi:hypothetical protein